MSYRVLKTEVVLFLTYVIKFTPPTYQTMGLLTPYLDKTLFLILEVCIIFVCLMDISFYLIHKTNRYMSVIELLRIVPLTFAFTYLLRWQTVQEFKSDHT